MKPIFRLTEWELVRFADPFLVWPLFVCVFIYGCPTAYIIGLILVHGYRPHAWIALVWGGLVMAFGTYFTWLHMWCVRELKRRKQQ